MKKIIIVCAILILLGGFLYDFTNLKGLTASIIWFGIFRVFMAPLFGWIDDKHKK